MTISTISNQWLQLYRSSARTLLPPPLPKGGGRVLRESHHANKPNMVIQGTRLIKKLVDPGDSVQKQGDKLLNRDWIIDLLNFAPIVHLFSSTGANKFLALLFQSRRPSIRCHVVRHKAYHVQYHFPINIFTARVPFFVCSVVVDAHKYAKLSRFLSMCIQTICFRAKNTALIFSR